MFPKGQWREVLNSDAPEYFGDGKFLNTGKIMETYLNMKNPSIWYNYRDIHKYKSLAF